jgi:hypothetical protein
MKKMKKREREAIDAYIKAKEKEREAEYKEWLK